ncbi:ABC-type spermidine/putrescine transport system, permease component II [Microbacterium testaceum StLB037]|uniref:ABC-type spermidine/putrescine transport system, permease component II n=1 Tax=Microbacterium testaceum (strain StLB037) TaxID=979556 RepID=E8N764_MICTS|nr:hypothetical protein [Microbacterium testaceum]BAJ75496.1 ABC-type spermidine/putrescine transport system, permease component II [Microbacterium testaceum StLB037]
MQKMDADEAHELERLRARAYGPHADITSDPVALARLRELEDRERSRPQAVAPEPSARVDPGADAAAEPVEEDERSATEPRPPRPPLLRSRRRVWIAALAMAVAVAATSSVTAAAVGSTTVDGTSGIAQTDALTPDPGAELGASGYLGFDPEQTRGFADYYGLTVFSGVTQIDSDGNRSDCLIVLNTEEVRDEGSSRSSPRGVRFGSCGAGPFPAAVKFIVSASFPEPFRTRYPVGTAIQFVLDEDEVGVFAATP